MFSMVVLAWLPHCSPRAVCPQESLCPHLHEPQASASLRGRKAAVGFVFVLMDQASSPTLEVIYIAFLESPSFLSLAHGSPGLLLLFLSVCRSAPCLQGDLQIAPCFVFV